MLNELDSRPQPATAGDLAMTGIAIASGKGGVGKTNVVANLAVSLAMEGRSVLVIDADFGLGNLDVLLGLSPRYNIGHLLTGEKSLEEVLIDGPAGVRILPAASGLQSLTAMNQMQHRRLQDRLERLRDDVDYVFMDTSAGISDNVTDVLASATRTLVVTNPEPTSLVDAYALIKVMQRLHPERSMELLVNSVQGESEAREVYRHIRKTTERFLSLSLDLFGWVVRDPVVPRSVREQQLVVEKYPDSAAARSFRALAAKLDSGKSPKTHPSGQVLPFRRDGSGRR